MKNRIPVTAPSIVSGPGGFPVTYRSSQVVQRTRGPYFGASILGVKDLSEPVDLDDDTNVRLRLSRLMQWNRIDLIEKLKGEYRRRRGREITKNPVGEREEIPRIPSQLNEHRWIPNNERVDSLIPETGVRIHHWSSVAFIMGDTGNAFTGVVMLPTEKSGRVTPKIYMFPNQPVVFGKYGAKPFGRSRAKIYRTEDEAVEHSDTGPPSHTRLVDLIKLKEKYAKVKQKGGNYIGFTVIKGGSGMPNRYSFQSISSNVPAYKERVSRNPVTANRMAMANARMGGEQSPTGYTTRKWGQAIRSAVDRLQSFELGRGDRDAALNILDAGRAVKKQKRSDVK